MQCLLLIITLNKGVYNMNKLKKVGLTALAGSLVATSVYAGELSVSGSASITLANQDKLNKGNGFTMTDSVVFSGSGEMDNGWVVSASFELDQGAADTKTGATAAGPFDSHSFSVNMGDMGTITFSGHGGSSALSAVDDMTPTANNEAWDVGSTTHGGTASGGALEGAGNDNSFYYSNSGLVDGLSIAASYMPSDGTVVESTTSFAVAYSGVEGLTVGYAIDENGLLGTSAIDYDTYYVKYAYGPITAGYQKTSQDAAAANDDDEFTAIGVSYQITEDFAISYNEAELDNDNSATDEEHQAINFSYTMGGMTVAGTKWERTNSGLGTATTDDVEGMELSVSFAF